MRGIAILATLVANILVGCGDRTDSGSNSATAPSAGSSPDWPSTCVVRLHGKGGDGEPTRVVGDITELSPTGNAEGWGARQWVYDSDEQYAQATAIVADALDDADCTRTVVNGFSNGAAFAAAMYCAGERFEGRVVGYVIDDPVPDQAVLDCQPEDQTELALYWTGALDEVAPAGADCDDLDWTCAGGSLLGIEKYGAELGVIAQQSPYDEHRWYRDAPETSIWLNG